MLGINGYSELVLIANSDPMVVTLCLAAIDSHLSGRPRLAFALLVLVSLGRPEGWAFAGLYAIWAVAGGSGDAGPLWPPAWSLIPLAWFVVPGLTSHSWFISGDLALDSPNIIRGNKVLGVVSRVLGLYELPMQLAVAFALVLAVVRRDRVWLTLAGAAALWVAIEIAFAYHGWSAVGRYLIEPAAVLVVLAGAAVGRALAYRPGGTSALRWAPTALVLCLVVAMIPAVRSRARSTHQAIDEAHPGATRLSRLEAVIARDGGPARIKACGQPVTALVYQSELAWAIGLNVGEVGYRLGESIQKGVPIVLFTPDGDGWKVRPINMRAGGEAGCDRLATAAVDIPAATAGPYAIGWAQESVKAS